MAGNTQKFTLQFQADTSQAKKAMNDLMKDIDNLAKHSAGSHDLDLGLSAAVNSAKELKYHLSQAFDANTGKLNLNTLNTSLKQSEQSARGLMQTLLQGGAQGQQTFISLTHAIAQSEVPLKKANTLVKDFAQTLKNTAKWEISSTIVHGLEGALSGAISYAKSLNSSLNDIRIVTGQTVDQMAQFAIQANTAAKSLSTTTKAYADASLIYYQQGDSAEQAAKKAEITLKATNASFGSTASEMSEYLTAVWNSYQVGAEELERYVDIMAALGAKTATSLEEIATSMQKVAATSNTVGVSMEQVSSIIATVSSVTRESAESIGTSFKTIFARIGDLKLGKTLEDGVGLGQVSSELDKIGISILDTNGQMRDMGSIIEDLMEKWQTMSRAEQTAIAQVVAGKRQYTQLMALMENQDMYQANMSIAQNADGSLQNMQDIYAESWEAASQRATAAMEGLYNKIINDQAIIKLTDGLTGVVNAIDGIIDSFGGMTGTLTTLGGVFSAIFSKQITKSLDNAKNSVTTFFSQFKDKGLLESLKIIGGGKAKNNEQIQFERNMEEWRMAAQQVTPSNDAEATALSNTQYLLTAKQQLINVEGALSTAQKARATNALNELSTEQTKLLELIQSYNQAKTAVETFQSQAYSNVTKSMQRKSGFTSKEESQRQLNDLVQTETNTRNFGAYGDHVNTYEEASQTYGAAVQDSEAANEAIRLLEKVKSSGANAEEQMAATQRIIAALRELLSDNVDTTFLDDANSDADQLISDLRTVATEADNAIDQLDETFNGVAGAAGEGIDNAIYEHIDGVAEQRRQIVQDRFDIEGTRTRLDSLREGFNNLISPDATQSARTFGKTMNMIAGIGMNAVGAFNAGTAAVQAWSDEAATLGDKLGSVVSGVSNLASSFAQGGWIGLAITAAAMLTSGIIEMIKQAKEEYQAAQKEDYLKSKEKVDEKLAESNTNQQLIKDYNTLYETYKTTGEGQDALAASARALADAYGLVGANVLIASGNFDAFNKILADNLNFDSLANFYKAEREKQMAIFGDNSSNSIYDFEDVDALDVTAYGQEYTKRDEVTGKVRWGGTDTTMGQWYDQSLGGTDFTLWISEQLKELGSDYNAPGWDGNNNDFMLDAGQFSNVFDEVFSHFNGDLTVVTDIMAEILTNAGIEFEQAKELLLTAIGDSYEKDDVLKAVESIIGDGNFLIDVKDYQTSMGTGSGSSVWDNAWSNAADQYVQSRYDVYFGENGLFNQTDYVTELFGLNEDGEIQGLTWSNKTDEQKVDQFRAIEGTILQIRDEKDLVTQKINELDENDPARAMLEDYLGYLTEVETALSDTIQYQEYEAHHAEGDSEWSIADTIAQLEEQEAHARVLSQTLKNFIGQSEATMDFSTFTENMELVNQAIDQNVNQYEELKKYLQLDEQGNALRDENNNLMFIDEEAAKKYVQAREQIAQGMIADWTSFDDFLYIYSDIVGIFNNPDSLQTAKDFITKANIKSIEEVNRAFYIALEDMIENHNEALNSVINDDGSINTDTILGKILQANRDSQDFKEQKENMESAQRFQKSLSEDMSWDEASEFYTLFQKYTKDLTDNTEMTLMSWDEFVAMDYTQRSAYLASLAEESEQNAKDLAQTAYDSALELRDAWELDNGITGGREQFDRMVEDYNHFYSKIQAEGYYRDEEGVVRNASGDIATNSELMTAAGPGYTYETINQYRTSGFEDIIAAGQDIYGDYDEAEANLRGLELLGDGYLTIAEKAQNAADAVNILNSEFNNFTKTGKLSADVIAALSKIGIPSSAIKSTEDYIDVMKQALALSKGAIYEQQAEYEQSYGTFDANAVWDMQKVETDESYKVQYEAWLRVIELMGQAQLIEQQIADISTQEGQRRIEDMQTRLELAKEEAELYQKGAEYLSAAISIGQLSNEQLEFFKLNDIDVSSWNEAATAADRAAIATDMWSQYAAKVAMAGEETAVFYSQAADMLPGLNHYSEEWVETTFGNFSDEAQFNAAMNRFVNSGVLSSEASQVWKDAYAAVRAETNNFANMSSQEIVTAIRAKLQELGEDATEAGIIAAAAARDAMLEVYSELGQKEYNLAQEFVTAWESAFQTVANLRKSLLMGESIGDDLTSSFDSFMQIANAYNGTSDQMVSSYLNGTLEANDLQYGSATEYAAAIEHQHGLDFFTTDPDEGTREFSMANVKEYFADTIKPEDFQRAKVDEMGNTVTDEKGNIVYEEDPDAYNAALQEAAKSFLSQLGSVIDTSAMESAGFSSIDEVIAALFSGVPEKMAAASSLLNSAATKVDQNADLYGDLVYKEQAVIEAKASRDQKIEEAEAQEAVAVTNATAAQEALSVNRDEGESISSSLMESGVNLNDFAALATEVLGEEISTEDLDSLTDEQLSAIYDNQKQAAADFRTEIIGAAQDFVDILTANGYGKDSAEMQEASDVVDTSIEDWTDTANGLIEGEVETEENRAKKAEEDKRKKEEKIEGFDLDPKEVDEFGDYLQEISEESEELSDQLKEDADAADEVAKEVKRYGKAVDSITDNYKDWNKALKSNDLEAQAKAVKQMDKAYSDMLDLDYDSLSHDFLTNAENLELMKQAAEGSEEAYNELAARAEDDLLIQAGIDINDQAAWEKINNLQNQIHNSIDDIEIGATIDDAGAIAAMEELINMAGMTADEATNYLASMGVDAEVVENTTTQEETAATNLVASTGVRTVGYTVPATEPGGSPTRAVASFPVVTYTATPVTTTKTTKAAGLKVTSAKKSSGGGFKHKASGGGKGGKGGGGGGGGGGSASTHDTRQAPERYHENTKKYNHVQNALDKLGKTQERSYGKGYLENLQKEADLLQEQIDLMNEKMDMIKNSEDGGYYLIDLNALEEALDETMELLGSETQWDLQINPDTLHIENWEEIEAELTSLYDQLANTSMTDEAWEKITEQIDTYEELMEQYEETVELLEETGLTLEELMNAWQEKNLEMITYKVEYQVELNEKDLELLEYYAEIFEDDLGSFGELMTNLTQQAEETTDTLSIVQQGIADLNTAYAEGKINLPQYQEALADFNSQVLDNLSELHDLEEQIQELYADALDKAQDELDKHLSKLDYIASIMEKYVDIQSLLGKGIDRKYLDSLYKVQIAAQKQSVASQKAMYDELLQRKQAFEAKMQEQGSLSETEQKQYEDLMETFMEVHENMLDALQATLETMRTQYENTIESIFENFEENMLGAAWSLQGLADSYSYYQEVQDRQLSAAQEIYQMSKLNRQIEQSIEDATTKANKQILKDLQAQINARAELGEMTEYDIEMMDLQYQIALKKMALEEAQAAKSVVRLTRDNDGNYAYQYTADEDQVNQAYQEYEDVLAQINDLASSRVGELEQQMLDAQQTYLEKLKELALDETMSEEEKIRKKQELYEQYQETLMWIQEQYQIATGDLQNNLAASSSWYNTTITEDSNTAKEKLAEMIENAEDWVDAYWNLINGEDNSISSAFTDYAAAIAEVNDIIQTLLTEEGAQAFLDMADNAGAMAHEVVQQLNDELDEIDAVTAAWDAQKAAIEGVKNEYEALAGQINSVIAALAQLTDEEREALTPEAFAAYWAAAGENRNRQETEEEQRATAERNHRADNDLRTEEEKRADAEIEANAGMPTEDEQNAEEDKEERDTVYKENIQKSSGTSATMVTEISDILEAKLQALLGELMTYSGADMVVKDSTIDTTYVTQEVEINAEFPNVEHMQDIKDALDMLINEASQRAGKNRP